MAKNPISAIKERLESLKKKVDDPILGNTDLNGHYPNLHDHDPGTTGLSSEEVARRVDDPILSNSDLNGQNPNIHDHDISYAYVDPEIANQHVNDAYHNSDFSYPTYSPSQDGGVTSGYVDPSHPYINDERISSDYAPPTYSDAQNGGVSYEYVDPEVAKMHLDDPYHNSDFSYPTYSDAEQDRIDFCGSPDEKIYDAVKSLTSYNYNNIEAITNLLDVVKQDPNAVSKLLDHRMSQAIEMLDKQDLDPSKLGMTFTLISELQKDGFDLNSYVDINYLAGQNSNFTPIIESLQRFTEMEDAVITIPTDNQLKEVPLVEVLNDINELYDQQIKDSFESDSSTFEP